MIPPAVPCRPLILHKLSFPAPTPARPTQFRLRLPGKSGKIETFQSPGRHGTRVCGFCRQNSVRRIPQRRMTKNRDYSKKSIVTEFEGCHARVDGKSRIPSWDESFWEFGDDNILNPGRLANANGVGLECIEMLGTPSHEYTGVFPVVWNEQTEK